MFNSISNNFGAGQITFKDYRAPNYVVLNAKVTFDPANPDYQACQQLGITVPDLTIDRSTIGGVFLRLRRILGVILSMTAEACLNRGLGTRTPLLWRSSRGSTTMAR